jgi:hypothetical protein
MITSRKIAQLISLLSVSFFLILTNLPVKAQMTTTTIQSLSFGAFCLAGTGGTIAISPTGIRTVTGDMIAITQNSAPYMPAIIEVATPIGTRLVIINSTAQLHGSNGGTMTLRMTGSDPVSPLTTITSKTNIGIGGTLTVGSMLTNPSGKYSGSFYITFMIE